MEKSRDVAGLMAALQVGVDHAEGNTRIKDALVRRLLHESRRSARTLVATSIGD